MEIKDDDQSKDITRDIAKLVLENSGEKLEDHQVEYIDQLFSIGIHNLEKESNRLSQKQLKLDESIREHLMKNFQCFVETAEFSTNLKQNFDVIDGKIDHLSVAIPVLKKAITNFSQEAENITKRWRIASLMLSRHNQLLEFLEIPQMVETCIRSANYDEALQLLSHVDRIARKDIPLVQNIVFELSKCKETMVNQLLKDLYSDLDLPMAMKVIGYLRALNSMTETELRIKFLNVRDSWLRNLTKDLNKSHPLNYMIKLIEIYRVNLFDIVTQYRSVFADGSSNLTLSNNSNSSPDGDRDFGDGSILSSWVSYKINDFLFRLEETLEEYLIMSDISSIYPLENVFEPCFYFGLSMSRVGADFRPLLSSIIERITLVRFSQLIDRALTKFEAKMNSYSLPELNLGSENLFEDGDSSSSLDPPKKLLQFIPLALLCNDLLSALNKVSKMVPLALVVKFRDILNSRLRQASEILFGYCRTISPEADDAETNNTKRMLAAYFYLLVPHIQKCFNLLSPLPQMTKILGLSMMEYNRMRKSCQDLAIHDLDMDKIKEPIEEFLDYPI